MPGHVYLLTNRPNGTLYLGVTANLSARIHAHRENRGGAFTRRTALHRLVWYEAHDDLRTALQRERTLDDRNVIALKPDATLSGYLVRSEAETIPNELQLSESLKLDSGACRGGLQSPTQ